MPVQRSARSSARRVPETSRPKRLGPCGLAALVALAGLALGGLPEAAQAQTQDSARSQDVDAYYEFLMARRLEGQGDNRGALRALQRAAAADPNSAEVRAEIASFHLRQNDRADAEEAARAALAIDEKNVEANRVLGQVYASMAEGARPGSQQAAQYLRDAIVHLERVAAGSIGYDAQLHFGLGRLYMANGEPEKAIQTLMRVVNQNPGSAAARLSLAQAYATVEDLPRAINTLDEIVDIDPRVAAALGEYLERAGRFEEAAQSYTLALDIQPDNPLLKLRRASVLYNAKDFEQAAALAAEAGRQHPDDLRFVRLEARARFDGGNRDAAIARLEATVKAYPRDNATQLALVDLYHEDERGRDAERLLRQMLAVDPSNPNALNYLGYILALRGEQLDEAIALVRRALEFDPDNGAYLDSLGWAYFRRGDLNEAEKYLTAAVERMPGNAEVLDHLGDVHAERGRLDQAIRAWTQALDAEGPVDRTAIQGKIDRAREQQRR